ncbi:MAG: YHS domain-containing (seleno)protein [Bacteroidota bacterium]
MKKLFYLLLLVPAFSIAQSGPDTLKYCIYDEHIGLGGYDPIAYFDENKAVRGDQKISVEHEHVTYYFLSDKNRSRFLISPDKYLPAYGGWCSMTLAMGRATTPKYDNFLIRNGQLYLFERTLSVNGRELWERDPDANEASAEKNYSQYVTTGKIN